MVQCVQHLSVSFNKSVFPYFKCQHFFLSLDISESQWPCLPPPWPTPLIFFFFLYIINLLLFSDLQTLNQYIQSTSDLNIYFRNLLPFKIPMFFSSPVTAKMQDRESYPLNLIVPHPVSSDFFLPSTTFLKEQAADFLHEFTTESGLLRVEPQTLC